MTRTRSCSATCQHTEGIILIYADQSKGRQIAGHRRVLGHDCTYVDARNALIPEAVRIADRSAEQWLNEHTDTRRITYAKKLDGAWVRVFNDTMRTLAGRL